VALFLILAVLVVVDLLDAVYKGVVLFSVVGFEQILLLLGPRVYLLMLRLYHLIPLNINKKSYHFFHLSFYPNQLIKPLLPPQPFLQLLQTPQLPGHHPHPPTLPHQLLLHHPNIPGLIYLKIYQRLLFRLPQTLKVPLP
jgi:hypothetical protein